MALAKPYGTPLYRVRPQAATRPESTRACPASSQRQDLPNQDAAPGHMQPWTAVNMANGSKECVWRVGEEG